ncbi:hypothetical protein SETIT_2G170200v2 [Setaria italica]|uniref:Mediator of RNA polymerase II transcription subunit 25 n=1 Tax=Setaria italica TaxID=4555 RepID=A0A368PZM7_SETIT|nr:mediator of RNA polymerase II transcription subunit 25-like [Setaria italica]RCV11237.1 hypothetical protein SETIT_2G170200v2 [Setaria italica]
MAAEERRLVIAVEGTAALGPYWPAILGDYVEKIVRSLCASELPGKKLAGAPPELALVVFHTRGPYSAFCVQRSGWTKDIDAFLSWLSGISFTGGGLSEAATCEGLTEALMILHGSRNTTQNNQNQEAHKHCILVAASNPYPLPTPVYCLPIRSTDHRKNIESSKEPSIADAETFAKLFPQCSVSLSVISPKQLPTLKAIYNAGKRNPQAADPPVDHAKNPQFLVLLSENFMEARTALSLPLRGNLAPNQTKLKMDSAFANLSVSGPMIGCKPVGVVGISTATVNVEPATIPAMISSSQLGQGGVGASGLGPTAISSVPAMTPTPGIAQQAGANFLGVTNNFDINMPIGQHPNAQQPPSKFVKIWEGTLTALRQGQSVFICKLEGYRSGASSEKLAADWPDTMQIVSLINQEDMNDKKYAGKAEFLVFRSLNRHGFLRQLKKKKLCAVIQLPSQTLLLSVSGIEGRLIGILFPRDVVEYRPSNQPQIQQPQAILLQQPLHQKQHQQS